MLLLWCMDCHELNNLSGHYWYQTFFNTRFLALFEAFILHIIHFIYICSISCLIGQIFGWSDNALTVIFGYHSIISLNFFYCHFYLFNSSFHGGETFNYGVNNYNSIVPLKTEYKWKNRILFLKKNTIFLNGTTNAQKKNNPIPVGEDNCSQIYKHI